VGSPNRRNGRLTIDDVVSPAKGATYGSKEWTIVSLNSDYKTLYSEDAFTKIPSNVELRMSPRQALQRPGKREAFTAAYPRFCKTHRHIRGHSWELP
jgi:hypothetical protein